MWRAPVTVTPPAELPLAAAVADADLYLDGQGQVGGDRAARLDEVVASATAEVEGRTATRLIEQEVTIACDDWCDLAHLPLAPVQSIEAITYVTAAGGADTLAGSVYDERLFGLEPEIVLAYGQSWPSRQPGSLITVHMTVGYANAAAVPADVVKALRLLVRADFDGHEVEARAVGDLLENQRLHLI